MKLVRQVRLRYQQGSSDKVYEVDLCEVVADRYVVNFRYGRHGGVLKDGSKTPLPVQLDEAERVFDKLVESKVKKGYVDVGTGIPRPSTTPASAPPATPIVVADPRHTRLLALIQDPRQGWTNNLDRILFRAGELRVEGANDLLVGMAIGQSNKRIWNVVRALMRCGDSTALSVLFSVWESPAHAGHVRHLAAHAILALAPAEEGERFLERNREQIDADVLRAFEAEEHDELLELLEIAPEQLELLHLCCRGPQRDKLLALLRRVPVRPPLWRPLRRIFKAAEASIDLEVYGLLVYRLQTARATYRPGWGQYVYVPQLGRVKRTDPRLGFSSSTRRYMVRRGWRTLRRLGEAGVASDYAKLAAGVLLAVTDDDARPPRRSSSYDWYARQERVWWTPRFGHLWAFNKILFSNSPQHTDNPRNLTFRLAPGVSPDAQGSARTEAFPELWDQQPGALVLLLQRSRCAEVQAFAARAFRDNPDAWPRVPTSDLLQMFASPYASAAQLAAEIAISRYDRNDPDLELVLALASSPHEVARSTALGWIRENPPVFLASVDFAVGIVLNHQEQTRRTALDVLGATTMVAEHARIVVEAVIDHALQVDPGDEDATPTLRDATGVLLSAFSPELRTISLDVIARLAAHPAEGVAELGAKILLGHDTRPVALPDELLAAVMTSPFPVVRGIGIRLYGELPEAVLAERFRVLCDLLTNHHPDVRHAARPLITRLAGGNPAFARIVIQALIPAICVAGPEGMHADVVALLRGELAAFTSSLSTDAIVSLLRATEGVVQELGGDLLREHVDPSSLSLSQICDLASSEIRTIRQASWAMLESRLEEARQQPEVLLKVLDADWEDSRSFAFHLVDQLVGPDTLSPELAIAICDSVRPDVQAFGRRIVTRMFGSEAGPTYLLKLSQHPSAEMQQFASAWLDVHVDGDPERLQHLVPYLVGVMTRPNQGRIAKARVMAFLEAEAQRGEASARIISGILTGLAATGAVTYRAAAIAVLVDIQRRYPELETPLTLRSPELRPGREVRDAV